MERAEYDAMERIEERMWWYRAVRANLVHAFRRLRLPPDADILDAGCGTGALLAHLARGFPSARLAGLDVAAHAAATARRKSGAPVVAASVNALPFRDAAFDAVFSVDVLYHRAVHQRLALAEAIRCLKPGGALIVNLPAYEWMRSAHDEAVHGARRYTRGGTLDLLYGAGFASVRAGYWNTALFPLMALRRRVFPGAAGGSDVQEYPLVLEFLFGAATGVEHLLIRAGMPMPFGGSVLAVAKKHG